MNKPNFAFAHPDRYQLLKEFARENRYHQTPAENYFWISLKNYGFPLNFKRQFIIGDYIADFANIEYRLIVEIDGRYHSEPTQFENDQIRTHWLANNGWKVLRFENDEVLYQIKRVLNLLYNEYERLQNKK